jgi:hypothetical protein
LVTRKPVLLLIAAVLLLANPLDCFSQLAGEQPSSCCAARQCHPAKSSLGCCKVKLFEYSQYFQAGEKSPLPSLDLSSTPVETIQPLMPALSFTRMLADVHVHAPPGLPSNVLLPLLI